MAFLGILSTRSIRQSDVKIHEVPSEGRLDPQLSTCRNLRRLRRVFESHPPSFDADLQQGQSTS